MNRHQLLHEITRRADQLDAQGDLDHTLNFAFPLPSSRSAVGMASVDGLADSTTSSATFCISDASVIDRDGDWVNVRGLDLSQWASAGAPVFWDHQRHPFPIGSSLNPQTGQLEAWLDGDRLMATVYFDLEDPFASHVARKVHRGLCRSASCAFVPTEANRRGERKARPYEQTMSGTGFEFHRAALTEWSVVGIGSNQLALLEGAPEPFRKCLGCHTKSTRGTTMRQRLTQEFAVLKGLYHRKMGTQADLESSTGAILPYQGAGAPTPQPGVRDDEQAHALSCSRQLVKHLDDARTWLQDQHPGEDASKELDDHLRHHDQVLEAACKELVDKHDELLGAQQAKSLPGYGGPDGSQDNVRSDILDRYKAGGLDDGEDDEVPEEVLERYR
jgi:hypothetical protein